jgi:glycosyltransferase involved in cell wall biosynthesis
MDLWINGRFTGRRTTGVERYAHEAAASLGSRARWVSPRLRVRGLSGHLWEQLVLPRRVPRDGLLWSPANTGPLMVEQQVLSVHDLAPLEHPEWFRRPFAAWYGWLIPRLVRRVREVVAVSEFTRQRLVASGVPEEKVTVVLPGVSSRFSVVPEEGRVEIRARLGLPDRYVLTVGTIEPRKNLPRLWRAWRRISPSIPGIGMVCVGGGGPAFVPPARAAASEEVIRLGAVSDDDLIQIYGAADIFALVSLYEGFGLTALEAMACGIPCLASRAGGIPEAVGEAALQVDPMDDAAIEAGLVRLLSDEALRATLRKKGLRRAGDFPWEKTAEGLWRVFRRAGRWSDE